MDNILDLVSDILVDALGVDKEDVKPGATLYGNLGAESIDFLDIVFRLERTFGIKIKAGEIFPEDAKDKAELINCFTVQDLVSFVEKKVSDKNA